MINIESKSVFIEIPKTGSDSISRTLKKNDINWIRSVHANRHKAHTSYMMNFDFLKKTLQINNILNYFTFTIVRNPWDRCVSSFYWLQKKKGIDEKYNFKSYIKSYFNNEFGVVKYSQKMKCQYTWLVDESDNIKVDFIGRFENLQEDFDIVCDKINIPRQQLPYVNSTKHKHYTEYYDDETRSIVAEKYAKDIEYFGYEFGTSSNK